MVPSPFDSMQASAHEDAVLLFERYAKAAKSGTKDWAQDPAARHHSKWPVRTAR
jgi:hypothetical protein